MLYNVHARTQRMMCDKFTFALMYLSELQLSRHLIDTIRLRLVQQCKESMLSVTPQHSFLNTIGVSSLSANTQAQADGTQ